MIEIAFIALSISLLPFSIIYLSEKIPNYLEKQWIDQAHQTIAYYGSNLPSKKIRINKNSFHYCAIFFSLFSLQAIFLTKTNFTQSLTIALFSFFIYTISLIDLKTKIVPDILSQPLLWIGLLINQFNIFTTLQNAVIGATTGYISLWLLSNFFLAARKKTSLGHGDLKLTAAVGAWIGWQSLPNMLMLASFFGILHWLLLYASSGKNSPIPFAPSISLASCLVLINDVQG